MVGGLIGARLLSTAFMLVATVLVWSTASRLTGEGAGACSAALFALLPSVLHVGSLATYDAMALLFVALATWVTVRHIRGWVYWAGSALILANVTKYASALFDPIVALVACAVMWNLEGKWYAVKRAILLTVIVVGGLAFLAFLGGEPYWKGVQTTTLTRRSYSPSVSGVDVILAGLGVRLALVLAGAMPGR